MLVAVAVVGGWTVLAAEGASRRTALNVTYWSDRGERSRSTSWTLSCNPAAGNHPAPALACRRLAARGLELLAPVPKVVTCAAADAGPQAARVTGRLKGQRVWTSFVLESRCDAARWRRISPWLVPPARPAPPRSPAAIGVAEHGNDTTCRRGNLSRRCATFNRAYHIARCGDVVEVASGSYGNQLIGRDPSKDSCSSRVVFRPAPAGTVTTLRICIGDVFTNCGGAQLSGPSHIEVRDMTVLNTLVISQIDQSHPTPTDIVVRNINGGRFEINGANGVQILGGDWGPCDTTNNPATGCNEQAYLGDDLAAPVDFRTNNVLIDGVTMHDWVIGKAGDHLECLQSDGGSNITIQNSRFWNCQVAAIAPGCAATPCGAWIVQNNWFGSDSNRAPVLVPGGSCSTPFLVRFNSFGPGQVVASSSASPCNSVILGNIIGATDCGTPNATYLYNVRPTGTCNSTEASFSGAIPYRNSDLDSKMDYHLTRKRTVADNRVPLSAIQPSLVFDYDMETRYGRPSAGSDERE